MKSVTFFKYSAKINVMYNSVVAEIHYVSEKSKNSELDSPLTS
jgi:hypothetical protein